MLPLLISIFLLNTSITSKHYLLELEDGDPQQETAASSNSNYSVARSVERGGESYPQPSVNKSLNCGFQTILSPSLSAADPMSEDWGLSTERMFIEINIPGRWDCLCLGKRLPAVGLSSPGPEFSLLLTARSILVLRNSPSGPGTGFSTLIGQGPT